MPAATHLTIWESFFGSLCD